ncbi:3' terminal RNA ribose 2'-O-methyltransferase Hen1 [Rapidithrix thailandica]|uniref:Small RNA 2'-O-methyltransferase n=1 Tax=Rapidithrix thailandica TaxID=413964 RepID=A0AAW9S523_9BACT
MLLSISTTHQPATDLGYLLHKHPDKVQEFKVTAGQAHVFYPEATEEKCTAVMLLDIDPVDLVRTLKVPGSSFMLQHYVNDRPYVASSFMSSAIAKVYSSALGGKCNDKPALPGQALPLEARIAVVKVKGGEAFLRKVFEPLGYELEVEQHMLDKHFDSWGNSPYFTIKLKNTLPLKALLSHLYVLLPVFDLEKHYWVSEHDIEVLLHKGDTWLNEHPEKEMITRRYLKNIGGLTRRALQRLVEENEIEEEVEKVKDQAVVEKKESLHQLRLMAALSQLKASGAKKVLDLGCGNGKLLKLLLKESQFEKILGMDVSFRELQKAKEKLWLDAASPKLQERIQLIQGSLTYRDKRLENFEAAALVEVIEHVDEERLPALERVVFEFAGPKTVVLTTPNAEYNQKYEFLSPEAFRHSDHRFEWTRKQFQEWTTHICESFRYQVEIHPIGEEDESVGASSQMAVFKKIEE